MKNFLKGKFGTVMVLFFTLILAGVAIFTALRLYQLRQQPVAPNVPSSNPFAAEVTPSPTPGACTLSFTISSASPSPTATPGAQTVSVKCSTPGNNATITWTPVVGAKGYNLRVDYLDNNATSCQDGWYCSNPPDYMLDNLTSTSTTVVVTAGKKYETWVHYVDQNNHISNPSAHVSFVCNASGTPTATPTVTPTVTPTATPTPTGTPNSCGGTCGSNINCGNGFYCNTTLGLCRNPACPAQTDCNCPGTSTPTPTASPKGTLAPTPTPTAPALPSSGTDWPTIVGAGVGIFVILGSLLLAL
jgi:hypothetical protein